MIQEEEPHLQKLSSEIHTDTSKELSISLPSKECTLVSSYMLAQKPHFLLETFFQSAKCQREPLFPTVRVNKEIEDLSLEPLEPQSSSSVTPRTEEKQPSDFHPELERASRAPAELWLESSLEDKELTSHS
jgi:hypothetical protein